MRGNGARHKFAALAPFSSLTPPLRMPASLAAAPARFAGAHTSLKVGRNRSRASRCPRNHRTPAVTARVRGDEGESAADEETTTTTRRGALVGSAALLAAAAPSGPAAATPPRSGFRVDVSEFKPIPVGLHNRL